MAMSLQQTKMRIRSVASTKKITKAMELVATSKLRKAKDLNTQITPYKNEVFEIISYCANNVTDKDYKYFKEKDSDKTLYVVVTSTLGLCGGYNINVEKFVTNLLKENDELIVIGSKGINYFKDKGFNIINKYVELPGLNVKESMSSQIAYEVLKEFDLSHYKKVNMVYTKFINSLTFEPTLVQLLPISEVVDVPNISKELLLEPSPEEVLDNLIPFYLSTSIKTLIFESMLSEQASRRTAMENATDNASELQDKLLLEFNKSRQAAITQEITEISGAANAIK
ncbi:MAG: ATP synthase F1 subunit gamma [Bacilli bacterium]|nr:ATP synthase F1 subunit gamma [Bacilli bacterium]